MHGLQNPVLKWMSSSVSQNRHEEAIEFGDLSDVSEGDSDEEEDFELMSLEEIQALLVTLNAQHEEKVATARAARERLQNEVSARHHPHRPTSGVGRQCRRNVVGRGRGGSALARARPESCGCA